METNILNLFAAVTVALISSYFGYIKLQKEFAFNKQKQINEYLFDKYIKNGLDLVENYLSLLYYFIITNNVDEFGKNKTPFYIIRSMDYRFNTEWFKSILFIESLLKRSMLATGKPIPHETKELLESLIDEVLFFKRKQELNITASSTKLLYWSILNRVFNRGNRKKILLLTKAISNAGKSAKNENNE